MRGDIDPKEWLRKPKEAERAECVMTVGQRITAAYNRIRQARLDAGVAPGEPLLWPDADPKVSDG